MNKLKNIKLIGIILLSLTITILSFWVIRLCLRIADEALSAKIINQIIDDDNPILKIVNTLWAIQYFMNIILSILFILNATTTIWISCITNKKDIKVMSIVIAVLSIFFLFGWIGFGAYEANLAIGILIYISTVVLFVLSFLVFFKIKKLPNEDINNSQTTNTDDTNKQQDNSKVPLY